MKSLALLGAAVCTAASLASAQSFTPSSVGANRTFDVVNPPQAGGSIFITQSTTQNIVQFNSVSCNAGGLHTDNWYYRVFDVSGLGGPIDLATVEFAIEVCTGAGGVQPVRVRVYDSADLNDTLTDTNIVSEVFESIPDQSLTIFSSPASGTISSGSMIVEVMTPDGQVDGNSFFIGSNPDGQSGPSYIRADDCGITAPSDIAAIGFPNMHIVMNVTADPAVAACGDDSCATAQNIGAGSGTFCFDNVGATNDGTNTDSCGSINSDLWYTWMATSTTTVTVTTVGGTSLDTKLAVYDGTVTCPAGGGELDCNDDTGGLQSTVSFLATSGSSYLIRLGSFSTTTQGSGTFDVIEGPPPVCGEDDCASAQDIGAGEGTFCFDNNGATNDGTATDSCGNINSDLWYTWMADANADFIITTEGGTSLDTKLAVYDGTATCPAGSGELDCNDDDGGLQSTVQFTATSGSSYLIRLGSFSTVTQGEGTFEIIEVNPCDLVADDGLEDNDDCASALAIGAGKYTGLYVKDSDEDWYSIDVPAFSSAFMSILFVDAVADVDLFLFDACGGTELDNGFTASDNEQVTFTNSTNAAVTVYLQVDVFTTDSCNDYDMIISFEGGQPGSSYCVVSANSTGFPAVMTASGSSSVSANDLNLVASPVPANAFGIFFHGPEQANIPFQGGPKVQCTNNPLRNPVVQASGTTLSFVFDNSVGAHASVISQGVCRNFQAWFRDNMDPDGQGFGLSNGYSVTFTE